jgi:hypothetical protein
MSKGPMPTLPSTTVETTPSWPAMPTETEIYILPDGRVVIADLPVELAALFAELGTAEPCEVAVVHASGVVMSAALDKLA